MSAGVYVETSIVSYLSARTSRDVVLAAHQQLTRQWWRGRRIYSLFVSQIVLDEAGVGDPRARARRLRALRGIPILTLTDEAIHVADELVRRGALPKKATVDALHIAVAAAHPSRVPPNVELQAHRERNNAWYDRNNLPLSGFVASSHLHARGAANREFRMKRHDPIIDELHKLREAIGRAHDFDVHRIAATIRQHEQANKDSIRQVSKRAPRRKKAS